MNIANNTKHVVLDYSPQDYQLAIHNDTSRYRVVIIGRRGGKTELALNEIISKSGQKPGLYWYVASSYKQAKSIAWRRIKKLLRVDPEWKFNEVDLSCTNDELDVRIELKGADNMDSLLGVGLAGLVLDECAILNEDSWTQVLRPMLLDQKGWVLIISTPRGKNWLHDLYIKGLDDESPNWKSWKYDTSINKYITQDEIDEIKKDMPARLFSQEIMAEFLDDATSVFKGIGKCAIGSLKEPEKGRFYVIGADLAKHQDFTVLTVIDALTREVVAWDRFQDLSWPAQKDKIQGLAVKYNNALVLLDSTGCLIDDQRIITADGFKPLKNISNGDLVLSGRNKWREISSITSKTEEAEIYNIIPTYQTIPITTSYVHEWLTKDGWKQAGGLKAGDLLKIPTKINKTNKFNYSTLQHDRLCHPVADRFTNQEFYKTKLFWRTVGYYIAEGWTRINDSHKLVQMAFHEKETDYINDVDSFCNMIGRKLQKRKRDTKCVEISFSCGWLSKWFESFGNRAWNKKIPSNFDSLPDKFKIEIIKGYWRGDGDRNEYKKVFRFHSASIDLILTMQRWLLHFGIISSLTESARKPRSKFVLNMYGVHGNEFAKLIGEKCFDIKKVNQTLGYIEDGFLYSPIKEITTTTKEVTLWEFEVEEDHSVRVNGAVVHNVGDPILDDLRASFVSIDGYKFTNDSKNRLIKQLQVAIEQRLITFPNIDILIKELSEFEYGITKTGLVSYSAPSGKHDDCVISLALAVWGIKSYITSAQMIERREDEERPEYEDKQGRGELVVKSDDGRYSFNNRGGY